LQSAGPLIVALWSLVLFGTADAGTGLWRHAVADRCAGDPAARRSTTLKNIDFNKGDLIFIVELVIFALYSVLSLKRPNIHGLSLAAFTFRPGAACLSAVHLGIVRPSLMAITPPIC